MFARAARRTRQLVLWVCTAAAILFMLATPLSQSLGLFVRLNNRELLRVANGSVVAHPVKVTLSEPLHVVVELDRYHASESYRWGYGTTAGVPAGVYVPIWGLASLAVVAAALGWRRRLQQQQDMGSQPATANPHPAPIARVVVRLGVMLLPLLVFGWLASTLYTARCYSESYPSVGIRAGCVTVSSPSSAQATPGQSPGFWLLPQDAPLKLTPSSSFRGPWWHVSMPIWIIISWVLLTTTLASIRLRAAERRASGGCSACGYSRSGLSPSAPCPECGKPSMETN